LTLLEGIALVTSSPIRSEIIWILHQKGKLSYDSLYLQVNRKMRKLAFQGFEVTKVSYSSFEWHLEKLGERKLVDEKEGIYKITHRGEKLVKIVKDSLDV
jgi:DNA-binding transcriptional ArsR family regulator